MILRIAAARVGLRVFAGLAVGLTPELAVRTNHLDLDGRRSDGGHAHEHHSQNQK